MSCEQGEAASIPSPDSSFDCVLSNFAIIFAPGALEQAPYTLMATVSPPTGVSPLPLERGVDRIAEELAQVAHVDRRCIRHAAALL